VARDFQPGEKLKITNLDYNILSEDWTVVAVAYPTITFSCTKYNVVDIAYVHYSSTETVVGAVIKDDDTAIVIAFSEYSGMEVGLRIAGDQATYLRRLDPPMNA
jgi:hypothetical protein